VDASAITQLDATAQSHALANGDLTSLQLLNAMLEQLHTQYTTLKAFIYVDEHTAINAARQSDVRRKHGQTLSNIDGLVVAVKDNIDVAGMPTTGGLGGVLYTANEDAAVITELRAVGAIVLGKLNMDEAAVGTSNNNPHHGQCFNPRYPNLVPGGSSGGSAAAVAAGLCSMALGTDTMGSVRIPAACCGIVGMKPSNGAISNHGLLPCAKQLDTIGPLCRSVRDLQLWWPHLSGNQSELPVPALNTVKARYITNLHESINLPKKLEQQYLDTCTQLQDKGLNLEGITIDMLNVSEIRLAGLIAVEADLSEALSDVRKSHPEWISSGLTKMLDWYEKQDDSVLAKAESKLDKCRQWFTELFDDTDILILPTLAGEIAALNEDSPAGLADLTCLANIAGFPAVSVPNPYTENDSFEYSLQLIGKAQNESTLHQTCASVFGKTLDKYQLPDINA